MITPKTFWLHEGWGSGGVKAREMLIMKDQESLMARVLQECIEEKPVGLFMIFCVHNDVIF